MSEEYLELMKHGSMHVDDPHAALEEILSILVNFFEERRVLILDAGCGYGHSLEVISRVSDSALIETLSFDINLDAVVWLNKNREMHAFKTLLGVVCCSLETLPFRNNSFHIAVSSLVLHHLSKASKGLSELIRICKNDGYIVIVEWKEGAGIHSKEELLRTEIDIFNFIKKKGIKYKTFNCEKFYLIIIWK
ncbi:MAG: hypothetical protein B6U94_02575 [Thermofilum sp. ex4484_79]|nr:MAG: hypothetical protein B6U94_02575 [Thermofilum sp. ex4484_79]